MRENNRSIGESVALCDQPHEDTVVRPREFEIVLGSLVGVTASGEFLVSFPGGEPGRAVTAKSLATIRRSDVGREVALMFENGDPERPVVVGIVRTDGRMLETTSGATLQEAIKLQVDGSEIIISARNCITLQCGKSSITLTKAGKIIIRGTYLTSRSSGMNSIKGGSVQIN